MAALRRRITIAEEWYSSLEPESPVNDGIIDAYLRIVERRNWYFNSYLPSVWAFDSSFMEDLRLGRKPVGEGTRGVNIFAHDCIMMPLHLPDQHWALVVVYPHKSEILALDPLGLCHPTELERVYDYIKREAEKKNVIINDAWTLRDTPEDVPKQNNEYDCGPFICAYAETVCRQAALKNQRFDGTQIRKSVAATLRRGRIGNEDFRLWEPDLTTQYSLEARATPPAETRPITSTITVQVAEDRRCTMRAHWDPLLQVLEEAVRNDYKPVMGVDLFKKQIGHSSCAGNDGTPTTESGKQVDETVKLVEESELMEAIEEAINQIDGGKMYQPMPANRDSVASNHASDSPPQPSS